MQSWVVALLLKGVAAIAVAFAYYVIVYRGSHVLGRYIKNPKLYDFLVRERGREGAGSPADTRERLRHETAVRSRQGR
jgi:hypothetical protein